MDCAACATKVQNAVGKLPEVSSVSVSVSGGMLAVKHLNGLTPGSVEGQVKALGYSISPIPPSHNGAAATHEAERHRQAAIDQGPWWKTPKARLTIACGLALITAWFLGAMLPAFATAAYFLAMSVGLIPIMRRSWMAARTGTPFTIETLMTIAALGAVVIGATEEAAMVVLLFLIGEMLEGVAAGRARAGIRSLTSLVPDVAIIEENGALSSVEASTLKVGSIIHVRPGDRVAADGEIVEGVSAIDEAPITGESIPQTKGPGDDVFAGTINADGLLRVRVTASAEDNTIARVIRLVEESHENKARTERFIDRFARYYTPAVLAFGILVATVPPLLLGGEWSVWIYRGLAMLLIGCPCALVISTPAAIAAGLATGARRGLLIKGGAALERLRDVTTVAFDKTGTLTVGKPIVTDVVGFGKSDLEVIRLAASLEAGSSHPIAAAVMSRADEDGAQIDRVTQAQAIPGKGVSGTVRGTRVSVLSTRAAQELTTFSADQQALITELEKQGKSMSVLVVENVVRGLIAFRDEPRPDAHETVRALSDRGLTAIMLTGDTARTGKAIGSQLGLEVRAELLPEDKSRVVQNYQNQGEIVAMVGDGINDAPALAAADVGIAMGNGTDVALETADSAILHGRVTDIAKLFKLSHRVMHNIAQNISIALGLKAVFLVTTLLGITGLWPAILADTGATVLVTMNAIRLLGDR